MSKRKPEPYGGFRIVCPHCKRSKSVILDAVPQGTVMLTAYPFIHCEACDYEWNPKMIPGKRRLK